MSKREQMTSVFKMVLFIKPIGSEYISANRAVQYMYRAGIINHRTCDSRVDTK